MVLSGDAMKEMARQAKATREERRSGLDARHKYIISKVSTSVSRCGEHRCLFSLSLDNETKNYLNLLLCQPLRHYFECAIKSESLLIAKQKYI